MSTCESSLNYIRPLPLYNNLSEKLTTRMSHGHFSITPEFRTKLCTTLNSLSVNQSEQVTILIIHYYYLTNFSHNPFHPDVCLPKSKNLPFGIKISPSGKGFSFDIDGLPIALQALLGMYCDL